MKQILDIKNLDAVEKNSIILGDCLEVMPKIKEGSIDMILCDLPYARTQNRWDVIIPFEDLWREYERIIKPNGCIALFADGMFMAELMLSNKKMWRYNIVWDKVLPSGFLNANKMPLRSHEEIVIFYKKPPTYNPQKIKGQPNHSKGTTTKHTNNNYGKFEVVDNREELGDMKHPKSIWTFSKPHPSKMVHPTEKSLECIECLIKTYTNEGDLILDNCMGSGTTVLGAIKQNRSYIGIEKNSEYFDIAVKKIENHMLGVDLYE
jgi:site-specific DNA-methyltransferase (adenine-specific)